MAKSLEISRALPDLVREGFIAPDAAAPLLAQARGDLVSLRAELRLLLGLGVTLVTAGVGLFVKEHGEALGATTIAGLLALAAIGVLCVLWRRAPAFDWHRSDDADWSVDALALLAIALVGAELAWLEARFTPLGANWPLHLLVVSLVAGALAVRFDSIPAWSLALSMFAAWRGVALAPSPGRIEHALFRGDLGPRFELLLCAAIFAALGLAARRLDRKAHFEPSSSMLAMLVAGFGLALGLGDGSNWPFWALGLIALGGAVSFWAFRIRRLALFAVAAFAAYVGVTRFLFVAGSFGLGCFWLAASTAGAIALLVHLHRRFRAEPPR